MRKLFVVMFLAFTGCSEPIEQEVFMPNDGKKITAPVSVTDVKSVLGVNSNDIGYLCGNNHGKINMWSKYKPVKVAKIVGLTEADYKASYYGLNIQIPGNPVFSYDPPTGGASSPYRLGDFRNYNHNAISGMSLKPISAEKNIFSDFTSFVISIEDDPTKITLYDINHHPAFQTFSSARWWARNVSTGSEIIKTTPVTSTSITMTLTNAELSRLGVGNVRIALELFTSAGISVSNVFNNECVLKITSDSGISLSWAYDTYQIGTTNNDLQYLSYYRPGMAQGALNLNNKDLTFGTTSITNRSNVEISQSNIYLILRYRNDEGKSVYSRCPVYKNSNSGANVASNWSIAANYGNYYLRAIIPNQFLPWIKKDGGAKYVYCSFQFSRIRNGTVEYYDISEPFGVNMIRSTGTEPIIQ